jgi:hypothetical protein
VVSAPLRRRTCAAPGEPVWQNLGVKVDIAERVFNHARERIEATYDVHDYLEQ